jgi:hypothetical protein
MSGDVVVTSEPGKGSVFTVRYRAAPRTDLERPRGVRTAQHIPIGLRWDPGHRPPTGLFWSYLGIARQIGVGELSERGSQSLWCEAGWRKPDSSHVNLKFAA